MRGSLVLGAAGVLAGLVVVALAQDRAPPTKARKATRVSIVDAVPLTVVTSGTPLAVDVKSLPEITVATSAAGKTVTPLEFDNVTLTAETTSSVIDVDGYRSASVYVSHTPNANGQNIRVILEFECAGIWENPVPLNPAALFSGDTPGNLVFTENLIGPTMRIRIVSETLPFPTIPDLKVAVYLKR